MLVNSGINAGSIRTSTYITHDDTRKQNAHYPDPLSTMLVPSRRRLESLTLHSFGVHGSLGNCSCKCAHIIYWRSIAISFLAHNKLYKSLVLSILLYGCGRWTLTADLVRRIQAVENKCCRSTVGISYRVQNKRICMAATGRYPRRTSGAFTVSRKASQVIMVRSAMYVFMIRCRRSYYKEQWMLGVAEGDRGNHRRTT